MKIISNITTQSKLLELEPKNLHVSNNTEVNFYILKFGSLRRITWNTSSKRTRLCIFLFVNINFNSFPKRMGSSLPKVNCMFFSENVLILLAVLKEQGFLSLVTCVRKYLFASLLNEATAWSVFLLTKSIILLIKWL